MSAEDFDTFQETKGVGSPNKDATFRDKQILNQGEDENLVIYGFKPNVCKTSVTYLFYLLTLGTLRLLFHWFPTWRLYATHSKCNLKIAEKILIVDKYQGKFKSYFVEEVKILSAPESSNDNASETGSVNNFNLSNASATKLRVYVGEGELKELAELRAVWCKKLCYVWDDETQSFLKLVGLDRGHKCVEYHRFKGFSSGEASLRLITYGRNEIDVPVHTILTLLVLEALTPFYIFQVFSLIVWFAEAYYYYTIAIIVMSVFGITTSIIQTRRNQQSLRDSVHSAETVIVHRGSGGFEEVSSHNLVPGDVIEIPRSGCVMQCDAVLLNGNCIVNESMLTGESVPITKTSIPKTNAAYDVKEDAFHTLFCGTKVIQTRSQGSDRILAVVLRTGFLTSKGELVRSILYPPPSDFKFDQDSYKFIGILTVIALLGCMYTVVSKSERAIAAGDIAIKALDLITIVVPPALPAAMTIGKLYALSRLKKQRIFCMNSRVINVSGSIDCVCFDKTGTLTEDGLDMWGVVPVEDNKLKEPIKDATTLSHSSFLLKGMATCHSLTIINEELLGDPLDVKVFEATGWFLEEAAAALPASFDLSTVVKPPQGRPRRVSSITAAASHNHEHGEQDQIEILRQYQFSSTLQRMSVITRAAGSDLMEVFCKGSPEMIISLSKPESVPSDTFERLKELTEKGYRVIALGTKTIQSLHSEEVQKLERTKVESNLKFVGLIVLENRVKPETPDVIKVLKEANIKTVMITGDNIQTALSVAKECGLVRSNEIIVDVTIGQLEMEKPSLSFVITNSFQLANKPNSFPGHTTNEDCLEDGNQNLPYVYAMSGSTWATVREHFPDYIPELVNKGVVFARMSGQQKQQLIQELQKLGYYAAMCGDGANDCGALKAAHVGISLSEEESSVASPFTSKDPDISCVPKVIKEGRAALATSLGVFKFMICYSLAQFASVIILYGIDSNLTSLQFLFIDICLILHFTSFFGKTEAYKGPLDKSRPMDSLLSLTSLASINFQMFFVIVFQVVAYTIIQTYSWFTPFVYNPDKGSYACYENYAVYCISVFQYIVMAVVFSKGKPYRMPVYTNRFFLASLVVMTAICIYITFYPAQWVVDALEMKMPPAYNIGFAIVGLAVANFACSLLAEDVIVAYLLDKKIRPKLRNLFQRRKNCLGNKNDWQFDISSPRKTSNKDVVFISNEMVEKHGKPNGFVNHAFQDSDGSSQTTKL